MNLLTIINIAIGIFVVGLIVSFLFLLIWKLKKMFGLKFKFEKKQDNQAKPQLQPQDNKPKQKSKLLESLKQMESDINNLGVD